jgi:hypothetical protein
MNGQAQRGQVTRRRKAVWAQADAEGGETMLGDCWTLERARGLPGSGGAF